MIEVKLKDGTKEDICLDRLAVSIDRAFKKANIPHASYISQIIAKNTIDRMKKDNDEVIPEYIKLLLKYINYNHMQKNKYEKRIINSLLNFYFYNNYVFYQQF